MADNQHFPCAVFPIVDSSPTVEPTTLSLDEHLRPLRELSDRYYRASVQSELEGRSKDSAICELILTKIQDAIESVEAHLQS